MKMGKKKLKFKFLFAFLICVLSIGLVTTKTYAFSTNVEIGDEVIGFSITNIPIVETDQDEIIVRFSNGFILRYILDSEEFLIVNANNETEKVFGADDVSFEFDSATQINYLNDSPIFDSLTIEFDIAFDSPSFLESIFSVFGDSGSKIMILLSSLVVIFYANNQLTFLGILALCGLGIAIILLIFNIIRNFLSFRG